MKPTELRIGNLLRDKLSLTELKVIELSDCNILTYVIDRSKYPLKKGWSLQPIPLTEEWLIRLGFNAENIHANFKFDCFEIASTVRVVSTNVRSNFYLDGEIPEWMKIRLEYVHQLQNLYFALTGEELTVKY